MTRELVIHVLLFALTTFMHLKLVTVSCLRSVPVLHKAAFHTTNTVRRQFNRSETSQRPKKPDKWNYNPEVSFESDPGEHGSYDLVTANDLEHLTEPPRRVRMLVRDFIEDSLYNPNYGYFPKRATIVSTPEEQSFRFNEIKDSAEFHSIVSQQYAAYGADEPQGPGKQLWGTPTEMFKVCVLEQVSYCY